MAKGDKHKALKRAAIKFFPKYGFKGTTVRMLAKEAKMTNPALYIHYKNKDNFLLSLLKEITQNIINKLEEIIQPLKSAEEKIYKIIDIIFIYSRKNFNEIRFILFCLDHYKEKLLKLKTKLLPHLIAEIIIEGQNKGKFIKKDPLFLSIIVAHIIKSVFTIKSIKLMSQDKIDLNFIKSSIIKILKK